MKIAHNTVVVVADGQKMLLLRNEGDEEHPKLEVVRLRELDNPPTREQGCDAPGRNFSTAGTAHSSYQETDFHQMEEDRFAIETAEILNKQALANRFERLIVVAPPRTLGELRKHYHKEVEARLVGEIAKDLTGHPIDRIEQLVMANGD